MDEQMTDFEVRDETETWPEEYGEPTLEPLGTIWDRTGAVGVTGDDGITGSEIVS